VQTHVALIGCVDKGSSIVAETIDLGTASATGGFAFAAAGPAVSGLGCLSLGRLSLGRLGGNELADKAGESLRHLVGKRHHAS
jgi:hypothetical protein